MNSTLNFVYFPALTMGTIITDINGAMLPPGTTAAQLPIVNPQFFLSNDDQGNLILCTIKSTGGLLMVNTSGTPITATTAPAVAAEGVLLGGHPIHRPK